MSSIKYRITSRFSKIELVKQLNYAVITRFISLSGESYVHTEQYIHVLMHKLISVTKCAAAAYTSTQVLQ